MTDGFDVLVQLVMAAMTTEPSLNRRFRAVGCDLGRLLRRGRSWCRAQGIQKVLLHIRKIDAILRPLGTRHGGNHAPQIEFQRIGILGLGRIRSEEQALRFGVRLHQRDQLRRAIGQTQIIQRLMIDGEKADGGAIFRRHVANRRPIGKRQRGARPAHGTRRTCRPRLSCAASA